MDQSTPLNPVKENTKAKPKATVKTYRVKNVFENKPPVPVKEANKVLAKVKKVIS